MNATLLDALRHDVDEFVALRHFIHQHPELGHEEHQTSELVADRLRAMGYRVTPGVGGTGVVASLSKGQGLRSIGLRADMDALPLQETGVAAYRSVHANKMHACGHDGHTAILLCAAKYLASQARFDGTVHLIFQPAEETLTGARRMIEDGLFERFPCDAVFALHNAPGMPVGVAMCVPGPVGASSDAVTIELTGVGGHGAMPHRTRDVTVALAALIQSLQTIVSRNVPADDIGVLSIGAIHAGEAFNVIPEKATVRANVRACDPAVRQLVTQRICEIAAGIASAHQVRIDVTIDPLISSVLNDPGVTAVAAQVLEDLLGPQGVLRKSLKGGLGSEDFASMSEVRPACYIALGNGVGTQGGCSVHNPAYDFNDEILPIGAAYWVSLVQTWLAAPPSRHEGAPNEA